MTDEVRQQDDTLGRRNDLTTGRGIREQPAPGPVPRYEIPDWRSRYGVIAGVTGRDFDLGLWSAQPVGDVMERWRAFRHAEPRFHATVLGHQVHRTDVAWHDDARGWVLLDAVDGHATAAVGVLLTITIADCIPIYLLDPVRRAAALLHSGWRGSAAHMLEAGMKAMTAGAGSSAGDIVMHLGVGICGGCYEVGSEVMLGLGLAAPGTGPWHADLRQAIAAQAERLGMGTVTISEWCSAHDRDRFYSHRASGGSDGRMVAYLGFAA